MINEQISAATTLFANYVEAWNNWKRTGYTELIPVNFLGSFASGQILRRKPFHVGEGGVNPESLANAASRMGDDDWITRTRGDGEN